MAYEPTMDPQAAAALLQQARDSGQPEPSVASQDWDAYLRWSGDRGHGPYAQQQQQKPAIDPRLIEAIAQALSQRGGLDPNQGAAEQAYQQDAARARQQYGMLQDGSPNALQGGVPDMGYADAIAEGDPNSDLYKMFVGEGRPAGGGIESGPFQYDTSAPPRFDEIGQSPSPDLSGFVEQSKGFSPEQKAAAGKMGSKVKKGELSDFFKVLRAAKSEDKKGTTRKALADLAKQLNSDTTQAEGGTISVG